MVPAKFEQIWREKTKFFHFCLQRWSLSSRCFFPDLENYKSCLKSFETDEARSTGFISLERLQTWLFRYIAITWAKTPSWERCMASYKRLFRGAGAPFFNIPASFIYQDRRRNALHCFREFCVEKQGTVEWFALLLAFQPQTIKVGVQSIVKRGRF